MRSFHGSPRDAWAIFLCATSLVATATIAAHFQGPQHDLIVLAYASGLLATLAAAFAARPAPLPFTATDGWIVLLAAALLAAVVASRVAYLSANAAFALALFFCAYFVSRRLAAVPAGGPLLAGSVGAAGVAVGVATVAQHLITDGGIAGPFLYRYLLTAIVLVCAFLCAASLPASPRRPGWRRSAPLAAVALVSFLMVGISGSRGLLLAGCGGLAASLVLMPRGHRVRAAWFAAGALAGLLAAALLPDPVVLARAATLADPGSAGEPRFVSWFSILPLIADRPMFGHGPGLLFAVWPPFRAPLDLSAGYYVHNSLLDYAVTAGMPVALLLLLTGRSAIYAGHAARTPFAAWVAGGVACMAVHGLVDFNLLVPTIWLLAGLCAGALASHAPPLAPALGAPLARVLPMFGTVVAIALALYGATSWVGWQAVRDGTAALRRGDPQQALVSADRAARWWPASDGGPLLRARIILQAALEQPTADTNPAAAAALSTALDDVARALARNPLRPETYRIAARLHLAATRLGFDETGTEAARRRLTAALAVDPRDLATRSMLAAVLQRQRRPESALAVLVDGFRYRHARDATLLAYARSAHELAQILGNRQALARIPAGLLP